MNDRTALTVINLRAGYGSTPDVLQRVNIHVDQGEIVSVIGGNGAGKSTLIKSIVGLADVRGGEVRLKGESVVGARPHRIARRGSGTFRRSQMSSPL